MARSLGSFLTIAIVLGLTLLVGVSSAGNREADASDLELTWGNWLCSVDEQSVDNFFAVMERLAGLTPAESACPHLGDTVIDTDHGPLTWGDAACDDDIDEHDALALLLWYAFLLPEIADCPAMGDPINRVLPEADWEATGSLYQVIGPYDDVNSTSIQFSTYETLVRADGYARNNGPEDSPAFIFSRVLVNQGDVFIRWIGQSAEECYAPTGEVVPCNEGSPNVQPTDKCLDDEDNDADSHVDFDDTDCVEVHQLRTPIFLVSGGSGVYDRYFTVHCLNPGPVELVIKHHVQVDTTYSDPNENNNDFQVILQALCVFSKGGSAGGGPIPQSAPHGPGYLPAAFPQSGGPPNPR